MICPKCNTAMVKCYCRRDYCGYNCMKCPKCEDTVSPVHAGHVLMEAMKIIANARYGVECAPENYEWINK